MQLFKLIKHTPAASQASTMEQTVSTKQSFAPVRISEYDMHQTIDLIGIYADRLIQDLRGELLCTMHTSADVYVLIRDVIGQLEDIRSLCNRAGSQ